MVWKGVGGFLLPRDKVKANIGRVSLLGDAIIVCLALDVFVDRSLSVVSLLHQISKLAIKLAGTCRMMFEEGSIALENGNMSLHHTNECCGVGHITFPSSKRSLPRTRQRWRSLPRRFQQRRLRYVPRCLSDTSRP